MRGRNGIGLAAAGERPAPPTSPKATDALRVEAAAVRKASIAYWQACSTADQRLENELRTAANLAHARNDGAEERACLAAARDVHQRVTDEAGAVAGGLPAGPLKPLGFQVK